MAPAPGAMCGEISTGKDRGCDVGRDGADLTLRPGKAVLAESAADLTPLALAVTGRERVAAGDSAIMVPAVRERALVKAAGRVVVFKAEPGVRKAKVGDADSR